MEEKELTLCKNCKSYKDGKCTDCFEVGVRYACINYIKSEENKNDN